jgi:tRNA A-37 threonylcarbamoyl transferase component Bud32
MKFYCGDKNIWQKDIQQLLNGELPYGWEWIKSSVNTKVAYREASPSVYYKQFIPRSFFEGVKSAVRGSRCQRAIKQQQVLVAAGFNTPEIICAGRFNNQEFMISEAFDGIGFGDYLASFFRKSSGARLKLKRQLLHSVGELVGSLHAAGIVHGDLRPNNILVTVKNNMFLLSLIDNERNQVYKKIPDKKIHKNCVQITMFKPCDMTKTDRLRLWYAWQQKYPFFSVEKNSVARSSGIQLMREVFARVGQRLQDKSADDLVNSSIDKKHDPLSSTEPKATRE